MTEAAHKINFANALMELRAPVEALSLLPALPILRRLAPRSGSGHRTGPGDHDRRRHLSAEHASARQ